MADIDVVPKSRSNIWLWVVLAIIVVAALWFLFARNGTNRTAWEISAAPQIAALTHGASGRVLHSA
jgi:hypothetical protein